MGQSFKVYNLTKKEYISPHDLNDGANLLELDNTATALVVLLANSNGCGNGDLTVDDDLRMINDETHNWEYNLEGKRDLAYINAVAGRWAGDKIVVQGDYARKGDPAFISDKHKEDFKCINDLVIAALSTDSYLRKKIEK